jgi:Initiator Replication protein
MVLTTALEDVMAEGRTLRQRTTGNPLDPNDPTGSMVKPAELVDVVELTPLTLVDRRSYNLLIAHAWDRIDEDVEHAIPKATLRGTHKGNERLSDTIQRLMAGQIEVRIIRDGKRYLQSIHLLATVVRPEDEEEDGNVYYRFPAEWRAIIRESSIFARLQTEVMFCFSSKYALALWEMVQKRGGLKHKNTEEFTPDELRKMLGVPRGKLREFSHFRQKVLIPAVQEVNAFSPFMVQIDAVRHGRKVIKLRLMWFAKDEQGLKSAYAEVQRHKVGRKARVSGLAEVIAGPAAAVEFDDDLEALP